MARHAEGWRLRKEKGRQTYLVRFRANGERVERSTGESDPIAAAKAAERIYADHVQRAPQKRVAPRRGATEPLDDLIATWLATDSTLDAETAKVWETYGRHWLDHFGTIADITDVTCADYRNARLRSVQGVTVRKELGALRRFLRWARERAHMPREVTVPGVPKKATGTRHAQRRRVAAPELSAEQIEALIEALPEWSTSKRVARFPIRARFRVQYETGLRPSTIDALETPKHWHPGARTLTLTDDADKIRWGRELPLTLAAIAALEAVCPPKGGLIFGGHDYREHIAEAANKTLPKAIAAKFTGAHLRSARATHLLERGASLAGVAFLVGHRQLTTTNVYARPSFHAASAALEAFGGHSPNTGGKKHSETKSRNGRKRQ